MSQFKEIKVNPLSISCRKLLHNIGVNDANYMVYPNINGKNVMCPFYRSWVDMIARCYSKKYHKKRPTYKDCSVVKEWLTFSNFRKWMIKQNWQGMHLDKDILVPGNKVYSPENCIFVDKKLNSLLLDCGASRGKYPLGVTLDKRRDKFRSQCRMNGKNIFLGDFEKAEDAEKKYRGFKSYLVTKIAEEQSDQRIKNGLLKHAELILKGEK